MPTLDWVTRERDVRAAGSVPYRLLEADAALSGGDGDAANMLIEGDNLEGLKALLPYYAGRVKCIYIDPPFNTGQAFAQYDDNLEHSIWLGMMYPRLTLLRELLSADGTIVVHLDDNEIGYAIPILDEIFGRDNRRYIITFKQSSIKGHKTINPGLVTTTNYLIVFSRQRQAWAPERIYVARERDKRYSSYIANFDDPFEQWFLCSVSQAFCKFLEVDKITSAKKMLGDEFETKLTEFVLANAHRVVQPVTPDTSQVGVDIQAVIKVSEQQPNKVFRMDRDEGLAIVLQGGKRWLFYESKIHEIDGRLTTAEPVSNLWDDLLSNNLHNEGSVVFPKGKKPESLLQRILHMFSKRGEIVLDSFLGSATTAAVAHKMGRRWIGIEIGAHARTHCKTRLDRVIEGEQGGISKAVDWKGGGGYRYYRLGETVFDADGRISPGVRFAALAAHIWFYETGAPRDSVAASGPYLGSHQGTGYALLYNGVLGDRRPEGGNVLTSATLAMIRQAAPEKAPLVVYGEASRLGEGRLREEAIVFKQTPYDVKAR